MKTLADVKRAIKIGTKILKTDSAIKVETVGKIRTVDHVQGNAFTMDKSWMWWKKADCYEIDGDTFSVYIRNKPHVHENLVGTYKILGV